MGTARLRLVEPVGENLFVKFHCSPGGAGIQFLFEGGCTLLKLPQRRCAITIEIVQAHAPLVGAFARSIIAPRFRPKRPPVDSSPE